MGLPACLLRAAHAVALLVICAVPASAQSAQPLPDARVNSGALTFTGGLDVPTVYVYRGIVQEGAPSLTLAPYGDVGVQVTGDDASRGLRVNVGIWNSLNTGSSGTGGPLKALHYAEQFHATLTLGLPRHLAITGGYLANTSPNRSYQTVQELNVRIAQASRIAPYALAAFELSDTGQLDDGSKKGTYLEFGAAPRLGLPFWHAQLTLPARAGFSLSDYYQIFRSDLTYHDNTFGFASVGGLVTIPLSSPASRFGQWNVHSGADVLTFGEATKAFNRGKGTKIVVTLVGVGVTY